MLIANRKKKSTKQEEKSMKQEEKKLFDLNNCKDTDSNECEQLINEIMKEPKIIDNKIDKEDLIGLMMRYNRDEKYEFLQKFTIDNILPSEPYNIKNWSFFNKWDESERIKSDIIEIHKYKGNVTEEQIFQKGRGWLKLYPRRHIYFLKDFSDAL